MIWLRDLKEKRVLFDVRLKEEDRNLEQRYNYFCVTYRSQGQAVKASISQLMLVLE